MNTAPTVSNGQMIQKITFEDRASSVNRDQCASSIAVGMTFDEITSVLGRPQRRITYGLVVLQYDLVDGTYVNVEYLSDGNGELTAVSIAYKE